MNLLSIQLLEQNLTNLLWIWLSDKLENSFYFSEFGY